VSARRGRNDGQRVERFGRANGQPQIIGPRGMVRGGRPARANPRTYSAAKSFFSGPAAAAAQTARSSRTQIISAARRPGPRTWQSAAKALMRRPSTAVAPASFSTARAAQTLARPGRRSLASASPKYPAARFSSRVMASRKARSASRSSNAWSAAHPNSRAFSTGVPTVPPAGKSKGPSLKTSSQVGTAQGSAARDMTCVCAASGHPASTRLAIKTKDFLTQNIESYSPRSEPFVMKRFNEPRRRRSENPKVPRTHSPVGRQLLALHESFFLFAGWIPPRWRCHG
jgi:hypothetical protein